MPMRPSVHERNGLKTAAKLKLQMKIIDTAAYANRSHGGARHKPPALLAVNLKWMAFVRWQEWQGSNLRPPVLGNGGLPIELHSCEDQASPPIPAASSIGKAPIVSA